MTATLVIYFMLGFMVGVPFTTIFIATHGDRGLNKQIAHIRRQRFDLAKTKLQIKLLRFMAWGRHKGYNIIIKPKGE